MNTKQIVAIAAIVVLAVASIGAAYAYNASVTNQGNDAGVEYYKIGANSGGTIVTGNTNNEYTNKYNSSIKYTTDNVAGVFTYTLDSTITVSVDSVNKKVSNLGSFNMIAKNQNDGAIVTPDGKTHMKLHIYMQTPITENNRTINSNVGFIAKIGTAFAGGETAITNVGQAGEVLDGYTKICEATPGSGIYEGDLYVPAASLSANAGFSVCIAAYLTGNDLPDANMSGDGSYDSYALHSADIKFTIGYDNWIAQQN